MNHLRAILLALVGVGLFILAPPGLDSLSTRKLSEKERAESISHGIPEAALDVLDGILKARRPLLSVLTPLQRPLRIEQTWALYGSGFKQVNRMEVLLEGEMVYRSGDDALDWMVSVFHHRRFQPMIETVSSKPNATNRDAMLGFIVDRAVAENPDLREIEVRYTRGKPPGTNPSIIHAFRMVSPDWTPERL